MNIHIELPEEQAADFQALARSLGVTVDELAQAARADLLARPSREFREAAEYLLNKNRELSRRLA